MGSSGNIPIIGGSHRTRTGSAALKAVIVTFIAAVGILSSVRLVTTSVMASDSARQLTIAVRLADHMQQAMAELPFGNPHDAATAPSPEPIRTTKAYSNLNDFDGASFCPPLDGMRNPLPQFPQFTQVVSVWPVPPDESNRNVDVTHPIIPKTKYTGAVRVTARILYQRVPTDAPEEVYHISWVRLDR